MMGLKEVLGGRFMVNEGGVVLKLRKDGSYKTDCVSTSRGYPVVNYMEGKHNNAIHVRRLVAEAFVPNPEGKPHVVQVNRNKWDVRAENLKWSDDHMRDEARKRFIERTREVAAERRAIERSHMIPLIKDAYETLTQKQKVYADAYMAGLTHEEIAKLLCVRTQSAHVAILGVKERAIKHGLEKLGRERMKKNEGK